MVHLEADSDYNDDTGDWNISIMRCGLVIYIDADGAIESPIGADMVSLSGADKVDCPGCLDSGEQPAQRKRETVDA